jgi:SecD/SecF fusion protein
MPFYTSPAFINSAIFLGLIILSGIVGHWLAKILRTADYGWKFGVILFAILASLIVVQRGWPPKLGVDLGGGSILVYKVDEQKTAWRSEKMDSLLTSISRRVNPGGQKEISVKRLGDTMVEIVMPSVSGSTAQEKQVEADEIRKIIRTTGALEFRIVATKRDNESLIDMAKTERKKYPVTPAKIVVITDPKTGKELAKWCRVRDQEADKIRNDDAAMVVGKVPAKDDQGRVIKDSKGNEVEKDAVEVLVLSPESEAYTVTGGDVRDARAGMDQETATPEVLFSFNSIGGQKFGRLTGEHVPIGDFKYRLAIVLDDVLQTAPTLQSAISDSGRITGNFTQKEVDEIVQIINAGSLPAALEPEPVRDMTTEATLGAETIRQSTYAMIISSIAVPLFMLVYYRFAGLVAVLVLSLNMLMLVALMILIKAPFTLPALAGLALTVGMAVDNNVLIYERLREELAHGAALRMAIRNAFHRVGVVIVDANITHLIAATVLWSVGTEQIKGFAVTFWLGAILSIWATMFVARVLFEVAERRRWIERLDMMQWIGHTKIDFMAWFPACATFSVVITVLGLVIAVVRGQGLLDIDFTGGVSVQTVFQKEQSVEKIRAQINTVAKELPDATVTPAHSQDEPENQRFIIDTSNKKLDEVQALLKKIFGENLVTMELTTAPVTEEKPSPKAGEKNPPEPTTPPAIKPEAKSTPPEKKPAETKPAETKPAETKPAETKPAETKPAETKPAETKPAETKPAETKPADTKPAETKPAETKPADTKPAADKPKQSQYDLPAPSLVAMVGHDAVLFAKADAPSEKANSDAKLDAKTPTKAEAKPEAKAEPKVEANPQTKPAAEKTSVPVKKEDSATAESTLDQSFQATLTLSSSVAKVVDGKTVQIEQPVRYDEDRLKQLIEQTLEENKIPADQIRIELISVPEGSKKADRWKLKLSPAIAGKNPLTPARFHTLLTSLESKIRTLPYFPIVDNIGSAVAADTKFWAVVALVSSWSLIILYLWIRFQGVAFGLAAVIALVHDVLVMLGAIAFSSYFAQIPGMSFLTLVEPFKINLPIVAAFLTIIGYSVNDTIVVFDRIREIRGKSPTLTRQMVNDATNQTLSRTVLTSFTVMLVVVILYIFGGQAVHGFAFALIVGVLTGTYSSIYVAAPILLWLLHPKEMAASGKVIETR